MHLKADIVDRVRSDFGRGGFPIAIDELSASEGSERIARCIVLAANGALDRLRELIRMADLDHRDVIVAGEYDYPLHVRDLRVSFLIDSPDDFWVGEAAVVAARHGYGLTELASNPATIGPFDYTSDRSEGRATFANGPNTITIQKHNRCWSLIPNGSHLRSFGLDGAFDDEERFRIQLAYYLSHT